MINACVNWGDSGPAFRKGRSGQWLKCGRKKEVYVLLKLAVAFGAVWAMGFFTYHFIRLLLGRRTF